MVLKLQDELSSKDASIMQITEENDLQKTLYQQKDDRLSIQLSQLAIDMKSSQDIIILLEQQLEGRNTLNFSLDAELKLLTLELIRKDD